MVESDRILSNDGLPGTRNFDEGCDIHGFKDMVMWEGRPWPICRVCRREQDAIRYATDSRQRDKKAENNARYRARNREKIAARKRAYWAQNRDDLNAKRRERNATRSR